MDNNNLINDTRLENTNKNISPLNRGNNSGNLPYQVVYPEVYYRLQPYIMSVCDQMDTYGNVMPNQEMVEQITDSIYDDVCDLYPDIAEYVRMNEANVNDNPQAVETIVPIRNPDGFGRDFRFGRRFRRRGLFRDLIDILLLSEFFRRRRRY